MICINSKFTPMVKRKSLSLASKQVQLGRYFTNLSLAVNQLACLKYMLIHSVSALQ
jgi:hypothetical protein